MPHVLFSISKKRRGVRGPLIVACPPSPSSPQPSPPAAPCSSVMRADRVTHGG